MRVPRSWANAVRALAPALVAAMLAAACASVPATSEFAAPMPDVPFEATGRFSASHRGEGVAARFEWMHSPDADAIDLSTPLGQTLARLTGRAGDARIELADGRSESAPDFESLTARTLGVPLPVSGLSWWLRAMPRPGSGHTLARDSAGRVATLRQDGWTVEYAYPGAGDRPSRVILAYPETEVRIGVEEWR